MPIQITCFKAYDIRGQIPNQLNPDVAYRIGNATAEYLDARRMILGRDIRLSSEALSNAVADGIRDAGAEVLDIDLCGTEMVYFATAYAEADGGIMVTASHNPADYNGLKIVREEARPISGETGLADIQKLAEGDSRKRVATRAQYRQIDIFEPYIEHLTGYVDTESLKPLKLVVNPGNGGAGLVIDRLEGKLPFDFIKMNYEPDGHFPNGIPNPMLLENQAVTAEAVVEHQADMGIAWDGDFDRCFLFDENGGFIEGYYIVGLLAENILKKNPGARIVHDPRLTWNTLDIVSQAGGKVVQSKSGHSFIKEKMREVDAVYGGEMSAHHYFRDFSYADSGMIPWLLIAELVSIGGNSVSKLVSERQAEFPASGEINREVPDADTAMAELYSKYGERAIAVDRTDGYSFEFADWRFNIRKSNTEPVVRLNVESRANERLMQEKTKEILAIIDQQF